jgi:hypothetical protein
MAETENLGNSEAPVLSVVITIIDGGDTLRESLNAFVTQEDPPPMEIVVPFDSSVVLTEDLQSAFPNVIFLNLGATPPQIDIRSAAGQHEIYDRCRSAGLAAARGSLIAVLEDRGIPRTDWARNIVRLHQEPYGVIGGAIEPYPSSLLNWAYYVCDFGQYGLPFKSGPANWVSDVNVSYKRRVIEETRDLWKERYREPIVHWALLNRGETLYLSSEIVVEHRRPPTTLAILLPERFHWGRLFGDLRATHLSTAKRLAHALVGPVIPFLLLVRHGHTQLRKGNFARYIRAIPAIALLSVAWISGEIWGHLRKRA